MERDINEIKKKTSSFVLESYQRLTPQEVEKQLTHSLGCSRKEIKTAIKELVTSGELTYSYLFGCTFLEPSFNRPVRVSKHIVLKPPEINYNKLPKDIIINIQPGASFGTGQHPTTRLCLRGLEHLLIETGRLIRNKQTLGLDIGTGSGVLAIASVLMGISRMVGTDIDACARSEAIENIKLNRLDQNVSIENRELKDFSKKIDLLCANLRVPSLKNLYSHIKKIISDRGALVLSGIKEEESDNVIDFYTKERFELLWFESEKGWTCAIFLG